MEDFTLDYKMMGKFINKIYMEYLLYGNLNILHHYLYASVAALSG